ncbi:MAG: hypothetical protein HOP18_15590, partial [Deltaproteobacteria bacterium]|nr:hypothetical protein [Deltaproteobacteria bacterium]
GFFSYWLFRSGRRSVWLKPGLAALGVGLVIYGIAALPPPHKESVSSTPLLSRDFYTNARQAPISFIENQGQLDNEVAYYVQGRDTALYFTSQGVTFVLTDTTPGVTPPSVQSVALRKEPPAARSRYVLKLDFVGANPHVRPRGEEATAAVVSYFTGPQDQWRTGLPTYGKIVYANLWPGIDLVYNGTHSQLKYAFVVQPGADPTQIRLAYRGSTGLTLANGGQLTIGTPVGEVRDDKPYSYQERDGHQHAVPTSYQLYPTTGAALHEYGFQVGSYDRSHALIIDPAVFVYSGFIGGTSHDEGQAIAVDNAGNAYITGFTNSAATSFPDLVGPDLSENGTYDAFVAKVRANGTGLIYAGYIGGQYGDFGYGIAVDSAGNAYVTGYTFSGQSSFPVKIGPRTIYSGTPNNWEEAFVAKVNPTGTALVYCGYIGGPTNDRGFGIAVDRLGNAYVTGETASASPLPALIGPDLTPNGGPDAFIAKVRADGTGLLYAGYIGGNSSDYGYDVVVDGANSAYIVGRTFSYETSFPDGDGVGTLPGPDRTYAGSSDTFVVKVKPDGTGLVYVGYVGGSGVEIGNDIAVDELGNAYLIGETNSRPVDGFPVLVGPDLVPNGNTDAFVAKVRANGSGFDYVGYIGGSQIDQGHSIAVDPVGNAYVVGTTTSDQTTFPEIQGPDLTYNLNSDAFVAKVTFDGTRLIYAGYLGGNSSELGSGVAVDARGSAYFTGRTEGVNSAFPTRIGPILTADLGFTTFVTKVATSPLVGIGVYSPSSGNWVLDTTRNGRVDGCVLDDCQGVFGPFASPVVGDWDGSGIAKIGFFRPNATAALTVWRLDKNGDGVLTNCIQDRCIGPFGALGDIAVAGDWTGTGAVKTAKIGVYRPSDQRWRLDLNNNGLMDDPVRGPFGLATDKPVVGDWTGNGIVKIGVYRPSNGIWYLDIDNDGVLEPCGTVGIACFGPFGTATDIPVVGDWTGDGRTKIGYVRRNATLNNLQWFLDRNHNGVWQGCSVDLCRGPFGAATDTPVAGAW